MPKEAALRSCFCQWELYSWPAARIHISMASSRLERMSLILSSAFGDFFSSWSTASRRTEAGAVEPSLKTSSVSSGQILACEQVLRNHRGLTGHFLKKLANIVGDQTNAININ